MHSSHPSKVSTLRGQLLGQQMRQLRQQTGLTLEQAAAYLNRDQSGLGRFERAEWPFPRQDVQLLLDLYGVGERPMRDYYLRLSEEAWRRDEWETEFDDAIYDRSFVDLPWLEGRATHIFAFDLMLVHGLLQTPEYAAAVIRAVEGSQPNDALIDRWVELRLARQRVLNGDQAKPFSWIVTEAALRAVVGDAGIMRAQLDRLEQLSRQRHISIRVLPAALGGHVSAQSGFMLFQMPHPYPEVAYVEGLVGRLFLEWPKSSRFVQAYDRLRQVALPEADSARLISTISEEL